MDSLGAVVRLVAALLAITLLGSLALVGFGLQSNPAAVVVFLLLVVVVIGATLLGARGGGRSSTPYW
ncbi:hypothetical protein [Halegenticoccus tardaugens]|uniref:hypothetical protein n=1 Tax=Halegenticoccus tardaugens TaxID=2071624 RepID=UPI00100C242C|nr:hypothetical protein [Halegenticoccus tardaugens]